MFSLTLSLNRKKILLPSLHIKLGVMKNFVKAMDRFACLQKFLRISMEKLKAGIFDSPQIRELIKGPMFDEALNETKLSIWLSLKSEVTNILGNHWSVEYEKEIEELLKSFRQLEVQISVKLHFLRSHLDYFPKNCGDLSEEQGECFHYYGRELPRSVGCKPFLRNTASAWNGMQWLPNPWKDLSSMKSFFMYFPVYYGTTWAFCEYISPKFSIICLICEEKK